MLCHLQQDTLQENKDILFFLCSHLLTWCWYTVYAQLILVEILESVWMEAGASNTLCGGLALHV